MASGDTRAEQLVRRAAVKPSPGMTLAAVNALLDYLSVQLTAPNYAQAVTLLLAALAPKASAS